MPINYVPGQGSMDAKLVVFGQSPGKDEMERGEPFVGPAGRVYNQILHNAKILRSSIWTDNMAKRQPERNKIGLFFEGRAPGERGSSPIIPKPELQEWINENKELVARIQPNVIVPLGNEALWMVTGLEGITKWRGSILRSWDKFVPGIKVIPSYHPSFLQRGNTHLQPLVEADFKRAKADAEFPELNLPSPTFHIDPSLQDTLDWITHISENEWCSCDIETRYSQTICVGLACDIDEAMCIPFTAYGKSRWSPEEEIIIWCALARLLENHDGIVGHNFIYDASVLGRWHRIACRTPRVDTMVAWHECYPALPKGLDTIASVLTRHPYYKGEKREWMGKINDPVLREYNCRDVVATLECAQKLDAVELDGWGVRESYDFQMDLHDLATKMVIFGINCSEDDKKELSLRYRDKLNFHQKRLDACAGRHMNVRSPKLKNYLYVELGLPAQFDKYTKNPTTGMDALRRLKSQLERKGTNDPRITVLDDIMHISHLRKLLESYSEVKLDPHDGRMRFGISVAGTETWRMTMGKSTFGGGFSLQTAPVRSKEGRLIRTLFKADEGKRLCNLDLARAEAMLVAWLSNEVLMIDMFKRGEDTHWHNAKLIAHELGYTHIGMDTDYNKEDDDHYDLRYCGKECGHAIHYKMGPRQMRGSLLKYGLDLPEKTCKSIIITYKIQRPAIPQWHLRIEYELKRKRTLETPDVAGVRKKRVFFGRIDDTMLREALAFIPQTTTGLVNHTIMQRTSKEYGHKGMDILSDGHDGFLFQMPEDWDYLEVFKKINEFGDIPMTIGGRELRIPREFETGPTWGDMKEVEV